jgi:hypothetical protein
VGQSSAGQNMRAQAEDIDEDIADCEGSVRAVVKRTVWELAIALWLLTGTALEAVTRRLVKRQQIERAQYVL